jgi:sterol 14-demethylase
VSSFLRSCTSNALPQVISDIPVPNSLSSPKEGSEDASYVIPKGHFVLASPGVAQMDPLIWSNAADWNPHRWDDAAGVAAQAAEQYTEGDKVDYGYGSVSKGTESPYQPFGAGRHRCIGESVSTTL